MRTNKNHEAETENPTQHKIRKKKTSALKSK